ncbi:hypothetical protein CO024_00110, partial [Candidatus Gracilibacteria bacterium CG_4_9_14_0_2_um_filter_38_7]
RREKSNGFFLSYSGKTYHSSHTLFAIKPNVPILVWTDCTIQIQKTNGLCKRTRKRLQEAFESIDRDILKDTITLTTEDIE